MTDSEFEKWLCDMPKIELHLHIDGSLQASRMLALANKNGVQLPYKTVEEVHEAYNFVDLQSFLDLYYLGASVLRDEEDFYHLMMDYLIKCREQNIIHAEIMVEPQTYTPNGVSFATMMTGFRRAIDEAKQGWGQSVGLILSVLRHLSEDAALQTLEAAKPFRDDFVAVGLASAEVGNPPEKFERFYQQAISQGYLAVAHAGEEGPPQYIWDSLEKLHVQRIDHGVRCLEDDALVEHLIANRVPLTVCPLSNVRLCVFDQMKQHNILEMLARNVLVTVNSDDPTYFGGFMNDNFVALFRELNMTRTQAVQLVNNSVEASFLGARDKLALAERVRSYCAGK